MARIIRNEIERLLEFLEPLLGLANSHMVEFFTQSLYSNHIPLKIQNEVNKLGTKKCIDSILKNDLSSTCYLKQYIAQSQEFTLFNSELCPNMGVLIDKMRLDTESFKLEVFMNPKKSHEVEILSSLIAALCKADDVTHLIDIGDGKGYLSSFLALQYGLPTLGVDSSEVNTCGAGKRVAKLSRVWKGLKDFPKKSYPKKEDSHPSPNIELYKQVTEFITEKSDLEQLLDSNFPLETISNVGLIGLHTCGNLAADSLKIFNSIPKIKMLCNVGCCYHLLDEENQSGFPLSNFLADRKFSLGKSARMIANQSVDRILDGNSLPNKSIYYRAIFEVLCRNRNTEKNGKRIGKLKKGCDNFLNYCHIGMRRLGIDFELTDQEMEQFFETYREKEDELNLFYLIRGKLAPVIESLILLDRLLFLHENGWENSFLLRLFDPVISPRCYGIVAMKSNTKYE